ncbi:MAG: 3-phosphoshikimate 1-carboxyvinyltransferase [Chitinophagales bacterium]|nr:3-phosphoshikimate 1-carboxyvinyltransferase [Chitinophagales bacterium]
MSKKDKNINGIIHLSGSKSISNRVLIIEALMKADITKKNLSDSNDTIVLQQLLRSSGATFDAHDAGTSFRFMTAFLAIKKGEWILTGSRRMKQRPISDLVKPLRKLGATIEYLEQENYPPLKISGGNIKGGRVAVQSGISSQFASALLMIAPCLEEGLTIELTGNVVSEPYIEMTLSLMKHFGINHTHSDNIIHVPPQKYLPKDIYIESDWSAASYYYEMAAFSDKCDLTLIGLLQNSFQGDAAIAALTENFGVKTTYGDARIHLTKTKPNNVFDFDLNDQPDLAPALFVTCAGLSQKASFTGLEHLQYKESDREDALRKELEKCGITMARNDQEIHISGNFVPCEYAFSTYLDHRMAMAFTPLAMVSEKIKIENPDVVKKSYPGFWEDIKKLGFEIEEEQ